MANQGSLLSSRENQGRTQFLQQYVFSSFSLLSAIKIVLQYNSFLQILTLLTRIEYKKKMKAFTHVAKLDN